MVGLPAWGGNGRAQLLRSEPDRGRAPPECVEQSRAGGPWRPTAVTAATRVAVESSEGRSDGCGRGLQRVQLRARGAPRAGVAERPGGRSALRPGDERRSGSRRKARGAIDGPPSGASVAAANCASQARGVRRWDAAGLERVEPVRPSRFTLGSRAGIRARGGRRAFDRPPLDRPMARCASPEGADRSRGVGRWSGPSREPGHRGTGRRTVGRPGSDPSTARGALPGLGNAPRVESLSEVASSKDAPDRRQVASLTRSWWSSCCRRRPGR